MAKINMPEEIKMDGITYVPKTSYQKAEQLDGLDYVIVRTYSAGVFAGYLESRKGQEVVLRKARRLWYWDGAASLSQLATEGVSKPDNCKFPREVPVLEITETIERIPCTAKAKASIASVKEWSC